MLDAKQSQRVSSLILPVLIFTAALVWQASEIMRGWDHNILAHHGFRQTQTAISAYYFLKDGFSLYTIIPVFGPPWIIPIEFPLYQWMLAGIAELTGHPIDQTGRALSLGFHYVSLFFAFGILRHFRTNLPSTFFSLTIITLSPLATYWAQGVLIESLSVALTLAFVFCFLRGFPDKGNLSLLVTLTIGSLAAIVKVTTFAVGWGFLVLYALYLFYQHRKDSTTEPSRWRLIWTLPYIVPLVVSGVWIHHANSVMATLPIAPNAMSNFKWYFGLPGSRFDPDQWVKILKHTMIFTLGGPFPLLIALVPLCLNGVSRIRISLFFMAAISGPLVFWNVYYVHDYYSYEILFFLCATIGLCFEGGLKVAGPRGRRALVGLQIVLLAGMLAGYHFTPYPWLFRNDHKVELKQFYDEVGSLMEEGEFLIVAGQDWDPSAAYTTGRRALMMRWEGWIYQDFFIKAYEDTLRKGFKCGGVIIQADNVGEEYQRSLLDLLGMKPQPTLALDDTLFFYKSP